MYNRVHSDRQSVPTKGYGYSAIDVIANKKNKVSIQVLDNLNNPSSNKGERQILGGLSYSGRVEFQFYTRP